MHPHGTAMPIFAIAQVHVAPMDNTVFSLIEPMIYGYKKPETAPRKTERSKGIRMTEASIIQGSVTPQRHIRATLGFRPI